LGRGEREAKGGGGRNIPMRAATSWRCSAHAARELAATGAVFFADATPERRDFARMCPATYCFAVVNAALDVDPDIVATVVSRPSEKQRVARAGRDRFVAEGWAKKARFHGRSGRELFALPERWSRIDQFGVAWLIGERRVIGVPADAIAIEKKVRRPSQIPSGAP
jgi:hypothetical protein